MARQFLAGYESGGVAEGVTGGTAPTVVASNSYGGSYALLVDVAAGTGTSYIRHGGFSSTGAPTNLSIDQGWFKTMYKPSTIPAANSEEIAEVTNTSDALKCAVRITSAGKLQLYAADGTTQIGSDGTTTLSTGTYYRIEIFAGNGTSTKAELRCNGNVEVSSTTANLGATNCGYLRLGKAVNRNSQAIAGYYDDAAGDNTEWCGNTKIEIKVPSSNGTLNDYTASAGNKYDCVSDIPYDDTGDYIYDATTTGDQTFGLTACSANVTEAICAVQGFARVKESGSNTSGTAITWYINGTQYSQTQSDPSTTVSTRGKVYTWNPYYQRYWKKSEVDALELGVINRAAKQTNCYHVSLFVEYRVGETTQRETYAFFSGLETGDESEFFTGYGTRSIESSVVKTGSYSLKINPATGSSTGGAIIYQWDWADQVVFAHKELFYSIRMRIESAPGANNEEIMGFETSVAGQIAKLRLGSDRKLSMYDSANTIIGSAGSTVLSLDTWYTISLGVHIGSSGAFSVKINGGADELSGTGNFGTTNIGYVLVGKRTNRNSQGYVIYVDDMVVRVDAHPPSTLEVKRVPPTADGDFVTNWTASTGNKWECVDEIPNNNTDNIYSTTSSADYTANLDSCANVGILTPIHCIMACVVSKGTGSSNRNLIYSNSHFMRSNTEAFSSVNVLHGFMYDRSFGSNDAAKWTTTEIDALQVGVRNASTTQNTVDAIYLQVLYEGSSATPEYLALAISGQSSVSGALLRQRSYPVTMACQSSLTGAMLRARTLAGAMSCQSSVAGSLVRIRTLAFAAACQSTLTAALARLKSLALTVTGQAAVAGSLLRQRSFPVLVAAQSSVSAVLKRTGLLACTVAAQSSVAGVLLRKRTLAVAAACQSSFAAVVKRTAGLALTITGQSSFAAVLLKMKALSLAVAAQSSFAAVLKRTAGLSVAVAAQSSVTGAYTRIRHNAAAISAQSASTFAMVRGRALALAAACQSSLTGVLKRTGLLAVTISAQSALAAVMDVLQSTTFSLAVSAQSGFTAVLQKLTPVAASISAQSSSTFSMVRGRTLAGAISGQSSFAATLKRTGLLALSVAAQSSLTSAMRRSLPLAVAIAAQSSLVAELSLSGLVGLALSVAATSGFVPSLLRKRTFAGSISAQSNFVAVFKASRSFSVAISAQSNLDLSWRVYRQLALSILAQSGFTAEWLAEYVETTKDIWLVPRCPREWKAPQTSRIWKVPRVGRVWTAPHTSREWLVPECGREWIAQW